MIANVSIVGLEMKFQIPLTILRIWRGKNASKNPQMRVSHRFER